MMEDRHEGNGALPYDRAVQLLRHYGKGSGWQGHCVAVSRLALKFGEIFSRNYSLDIEFLRTAALLHDIGRYKTHDPILHGVEGFRLLSSLCYHREAFVCASHILFGLEREEAVQYGLPAMDFIPMSFEERLIPVLDSLVELDRPTTVEGRLSSIQKRYRGNDFFLHRIETAAVMARDFIGKMDEEFGISMERIAHETLL